MSSVVFTLRGFASWLTAHFWKTPVKTSPSSCTREKGWTKRPSGTTWGRGKLLWCSSARRFQLISGLFFRIIWSDLIKDVLRPKLSVCSGVSVRGILLVQRRLQHQSASRFPGVARVHGPEPGAGSPAVSVELPAARRGSEDRPNDGGVRPKILSLQPRSFSKHGLVALHTVLLKHPKMSQPRNRFKTSVQQIHLLPAK